MAPRRAPERIGTMSLTTTAAASLRVEALLPAAKLQRPILHGETVERTRLADRLRRCRDPRILLLCAPAGYGKSVFVVQRVGADPRPAAWLHLDGSDNAPAQLAQGLVGAVDQLSAVPRQLSTLVERPDPGSEHAVLPLLVRHVGAMDPFVVVLDHVDAVSGAGAVAVLQAFIDAVPAGSQVVLVSRAEPLVRLARHRASGELLAFRTADLAFDGEELRALAELSNLPLDDGALQLLHHHTQGWATGAALALRAWERHGAGDQVRALTGTTPEVAAYLREEVLDAQPPSLRTFLLVTSGLERMSAALGATTRSRKCAVELSPALAASRRSAAMMSWSSQIDSR